MIHHTKIADVVALAPVKFGSTTWISPLPLLDRAHSLPDGNHLLARLNYDENSHAAMALGGRLPTSEEIELLRKVGLQLTPFLGTPRAENGIEHSEAHDRSVYAQLAKLGWDRTTPVAGAGKHWIAGAPEGESRLKGWDKDGAGPGTAWWQPDQVAHNRFHFDDGTTSLVVWDREPKGRSWFTELRLLLKRPVSDDSLFRPTRNTPTPPLDVLAALRRAWPEGSRESLLVLLAQWGIETGDGAKCWNYNLGNVKRLKGQPWTMLAGTWEILGGKKVVFQPPHPQTHFAAFDSLDEGASFYLEKMRGRFAPAWPAVLAGDPSQFAADLKRLGYYTAPLDTMIDKDGIKRTGYRQAMVARFKQFDQLERVGSSMTAAGDLRAKLLELRYADVRSFQRASGLVVDGIVGPRTRAALDAAWAAR